MGHCHALQRKRAVHEFMHVFTPVAQQTDWPAVQLPLGPAQDFSCDGTMPCPREGRSMHNEAYEGMTKGGAESIL